MYCFLYVLLICHSLIQKVYIVRVSSMCYKWLLHEILCVDEGSVVPAWLQICMSSRTAVCRLWSAESCDGAV